MDCYNVLNPCRLYPLEPIGIGTPDAESLSGYIKRLANLHMVSVGNLIHKEVIPDIKDGGTKVNKFFSDRNSINSLNSDLSKEVASILSQKTGINDLSCLTLKSFSNYLCTHNMYRSHLAWCPICFEEGLNSGQVYEKLMWHFKDVETCNKHKIKLVQECPYCNNPVKVLNFRSRVGFCDKCHSWLGLSKYPKRMAITKWDDWVIYNISELFMNSKDIRLDGNEQFQRNLTNILNAYKISLYSLHNLSDVNVSTFQNWLIRGKPNLHGILNLSFKSGYSVLELLTKEIKCPQKEFANILKPYPEKKQYNTLDIKTLLKKVIESNGEISLRKLSLENGISVDYIKKTFPKESQIIISNFNFNGFTRNPIIFDIYTMTQLIAYCHNTWIYTIIN